MAAKGEASEAEGGEGYFASISDLMVGILFVFLLMLTVFALNYRDAEQEQVVALERYERLQAEAETARAEALRQAEAVRLAVIETARQEERARAREVEANLLRVRNQALTEALDRTIARLQSEIRDREDARADLLARLAEGLSARGVSFRLDPQSGVLRLSEDVPFNSGRSDLTDRTRRTVQVLAEVLVRVLPCFAKAPDRQGCGARDAPILEAVLVEGHTDRQQFMNLTAQQSQQENDRLSASRALTVFAEMRRLQTGLERISNSDGIPLLGVSGYGERRPLPDALGMSETELAQNRRIDLRFVLSSRTSEEVRRLIEEIDRLRRPAK
jgi:flagellar motor protein MotB